MTSVTCQPCATFCAENHKSMQEENRTFFMRVFAQQAAQRLFRRTFAYTVMDFRTVRICGLEAVLC
jgi:hypothetical protein